MTAKGKKKKKPIKEERSRWGRLCRIVAFVIGIPGIYVGVVSVFPRIAVTPGEQLTPTDFLATAFNIKNDGFLSIYDVSGRCAFREVVIIQGSRPQDILEIHGMENYSSSASFANDPFAVDELAPDSSLDYPCTNPFVSNRPLRDTDIGIIISFRPSIFPWPKQERVYKFITAKDPASGSIHWISKGAAWLKWF